jgi:hypothetical protein
VDVLVLRNSVLVNQAILRDIKNLAFGVADVFQFSAASDTNATPDLRGIERIMV